MAHFKSKGADAHAIRLDVTDRKAYIAAADEVERCTARRRSLSSRRPRQRFRAAEASTYEDYEWIVGVNLYGVINGMVTFVPRMIKAGLGGHIVTVASLGGLGPCATTAPYSCSKAAVINLMETYHEALKPYGIGVMAFCPGNMNTNIHEASKTRRRTCRAPATTRATRPGAYGSTTCSVWISARWASGQKGVEEGVVLCIP
jgi:NAD(P)-dependent dehydrogenase (short-subunit alcohol dehydrogenase family)